MLNNSIELTDLTAENAVEKVVNALVDALGWIPDEDGERVWINENKSLGVKVSSGQGNVALVSVNKQGVAASGQVTAAISTPVMLDYENSKGKTAVIVGIRPAAANPLNSGTIIFAKKSDGVYSSITSVSNNVYELCEGAAQFKTISIITNTTESVSPYTSIYKLPSLYGGIFDEVYAAYSCPTNNIYVRFAIDGRVFQATNISGKRFAVEVSD